MKEVREFEYRTVNGDSRTRGLLIVLPALIQVLFLVWAWQYGGTHSYHVVFWSTLASASLVILYAIYAQADIVLAFAICIAMEIATALFACQDSVSPTSQNMIIWVSLLVGMGFAVLFPCVFNFLCRNAKAALFFLWGVTLALTIVMKVSGTIFLQVAGTRLEMAELFKVFSAAYYAILFRVFRSDRSRLKWILSFAVFTAACLVWLNEYGTMVVTVIIFLTELIVFEKKTAYVVWTVVGFVGGAAGIIGLALYVSGMQGSVASQVTSFLHLDKLANRFTVFLHNGEGGDAGYQMKKSLEGIAWGGFLGRKANVKIPVSESDFAFARLCECMGALIGFVYILCIHLMLICMFKSVKRTAHGGNKGVGMFVTGLGTGICVQSILSCGTTVGLFPVMGNPSMFISTGGSFRCLTCSVLFLALRLSSKRHPIEEVSTANRRRRQWNMKMRRNSYRRW